MLKLNIYSFARFNAMKLVVLLTFFMLTVTPVFASGGVGTEGGDINTGQATALYNKMKPFVTAFLTVLSAVLVVYTVIAFGRVGYQFMTQPDDPNIRTLLVDTIRNVVIGWIIVVVAVVAAQFITQGAGFTF